MADIKMEEGGEVQPPSPKRPRKVKPNADKKFECKFEGCGKVYSRAEHLYRHDLNREPSPEHNCLYARS